MPITPRVALGAERWTFDVSAAAERRAEVILEHPDAQAGGPRQIPAAAWSLRLDRSPRSATLAVVDANGYLGFTKLRQVLRAHAGESDALTCYLHPPNDQVIYQCAETVLARRDLDRGLSASLRARPLKTELAIGVDDIRGFAPALALELKDGTRVELLGEVDRLGLRPGLVRVLANGRGGRTARARRSGARSRRCGRLHRWG
jgi:hypothetical protein